MSIDRIEQPRGSRLCGQACVAMVAGVSLADAIKAVGHRRGTTVADLIRGLKKLSVRCGSRLELVHPDHDSLPEFCILQAKRPRRRNWHWLVLYRGGLYDPSPHPPTTDRYINAFLSVHG